jgi:hypothetical protein
MDAVEPNQEVKGRVFASAVMPTEHLIQVRVRLGSLFDRPQEPIRDRIPDRIPEDMKDGGFAILPDRQGRQEMRDTDGRRRTG